MNYKKESILILGILLVVLLTLAPLTVATLNRITGVSVTVHNISGGPTYNAIKTGDSNGTVLTCVDTDLGFNPTLRGDMNVTFSDANGLFTYRDKCIDTNSLSEFACGKDVNVNGGMAQNNNAYSFTFNCGDLNKSCSAGRCV